MNAEWEKRRENITCVFPALDTSECCVSPAVQPDGQYKQNECVMLWRVLDQLADTAQAVWRQAAESLSKFKDSLVPLGAFLWQFYDYSWMNDELKIKLEYLKIFVCVRVCTGQVFFFFFFLPVKHEGVPLCLLL